jgi:hypothetical protein
MKHSALGTASWAVGPFAFVLLAVSAAFGQPAETPAKASIVARAEVCTSIEDREPAGVSNRFDADVDQLYCFTEIRGAEGAVVTHAWIHEGTTRARVELPVRSPRWRTWSSKQILPGWTGDWQVKILDADGVVLETLEFVVE